MSELPDLPDFCWPINHSCDPNWDALTDPDSPAGEDNPPVYTDEAKAIADALAGQTLRYLTGYRVGGCPVTVRPCREACIDPTWRTFPVAWDGTGGAPWFPVNWAGSWLNVGCGCAGGCGCTTVSEVVLAGPVGAIAAVKVDGVVVDPSLYQVQQGNRLVSLGAPWPLCQDLTKPDTEEGTWSVSYTAGAAVDGLGAWVAGILASEYVKACSGQECRLPAGVTTVVRDGVTLDLGPGSFPGNRTGIREVDDWVARWNPNGLRAPSQVFSLDLHRPRTLS